MGETLNDFFLERGGLHGDFTAAIARLFDVPPESVHYHPIAAIPYPLEDTRLIVGWNVRRGQYPVHLSITPINGATLRLSQTTALRQLCTELGISCLADVGETVVPEWVRISPDGRVESVIVDEPEDDLFIIYERDAFTTDN